jgi:hypothetical protein
MTERAPLSAPDDPRRAESGTPADRRVASAPVEHVRARCPTLIDTLVAMARASRDGQDLDDTAPNRRRRAGLTGGPADVAS